MLAEVVLVIAFGRDRSTVTLEVLLHLFSLLFDVLQGRDLGHNLGRLRSCDVSRSGCVQQASLIVIVVLMQLKKLLVSLG
jgi:hypothetical protein